MENMRNPEIVKTFDAYRQNFKPYGLTCELWQTDIMPRFDCHNEIELNYFVADSDSYECPPSKIKDRIIDL